MRRILGTLAVGAALFALPRPASAQDAAEVARGAQQWSQTCTRCHNARPSAERTDRQWTTIVAHMRARANLTRSRADAIAVFLQATNGLDQRPAAANGVREDEPDEAAVAETDDARTEEAPDATAEDTTAADTTAADTTAADTTAADTTAEASDARDVRGSAQATNATGLTAAQRERLVEYLKRLGGR